VTDPRTALVAAGYDAMIDTWETWKAQITDDPRADWCDELVARLPRGGRVVELGCGGGTDETRLLAERFRLTAIDLSAEQLRRARERVPERRSSTGTSRSSSSTRPRSTRWRRSTS